jgi:hypothetical protein
VNEKLQAQISRLNAQSMVGVELKNTILKISAKRETEQEEK